MRIPKTVVAAAALALLCSPFGAMAAAISAKSHEHGIAADAGRLMTKAAKDLRSDFDRVEIGGRTYAVTLVRAKVLGTRRVGGDATHPAFAYRIYKNEYRGGGRAFTGYSMVKVYEDGRRRAGLRPEVSFYNVVFAGDIRNVGQGRIVAHDCGTMRP